MSEAPELNVWREASDAASWNAIKWKPTAEKRAAAVIRSYGDQRDADAYERGKLEGARLAIEAAIREADEHARLAWKIGEREGQSSICSSGRNYGARAVGQSIRALSPAKIVGEG